MTEPAKPTRNAEATRRALLRAGQRRFTLLGYERTTIRDVARDAGVNLALINRYFGGKEGLFRAVLASAPELMAEAERESEPPEDLLDTFLDGLRPDAWPEFGAHPLLLLMRDIGANEDVETLRSLATGTAVTRILAAAGVDPGEPGSERRRAVELRAQLVHALFLGVLSLRSLTPVEPLASADADELRPALRAALEALLAEP